MKIDFYHDITFLLGGNFLLLPAVVYNLRREGVSWLKFAKILKLAKILIE